MISIYEILKAVTVRNYDNGRMFTASDRLDTISKLLWNSPYRRINAQGLFHLYAARPIEQIRNSIILVSTHVDTDMNITRFFTGENDDGLMKGTFDNSITNAAILQLMLSGVLPENVVVAFTGGKEADYEGAKQVSRYLKKAGADIEMAVVLDVTNMGWKENGDFTIENDFWTEEQGNKVIALMKSLSGQWFFVPENTDDVPPYIYSDRVIRIEAEEDETWTYDSLDITCFSLRIPVYGSRRSDKGILADKASLGNYVKALEKILRYW